MDEARKIVTRSLAHGTGIAKVGGVWCGVDNTAASCDGNPKPPLVYGIHCDSQGLGIGAKPPLPKLAPLDQPELIRTHILAVQYDLATVRAQALQLTSSRGGGVCVVSVCRPFASSRRGVACGVELGGARGSRHQSQAIAGL